MISEQTARYLNLGCGQRFHPQWINMDLTASGPGVIACDLSKGIPLPDGHCEVVYHSHLLEHIRRADALPFMKECFRVLKPRGILRVAVPDLEIMARLYLEKLERALRGDAGSAHDYNWIVIEMFDQAVREHWQSAMWAYLNSPAVPNEAFVRQRIGEFRSGVSPAQFRSLPGRVRQMVRGGTKWLVNRLMWLKPVRAWNIGRFRLSGENHQWMYDRYSLAQLMLAADFKNPVQQTASTSLIPGWGQFDLDATPKGKVYKPDSLFMEAIKPT